MRQQKNKGKSPYFLYPLINNMKRIGMVLNSPDNRFMNLMYYNLSFIRKFSALLITSLDALIKLFRKVL